MIEIELSPKAAISFIVDESIFDSVRNQLIDFLDNHSPTIMMDDLVILRLGIETLIRKKKDSDTLYDTKGLKDTFMVEFDIKRGRGHIHIGVSDQFDPIELKKLIITTLKKGDEVELIDPIKGVSSFVVHN